MKVLRVDTFGWKLARMYYNDILDMMSAQIELVVGAVIKQPCKFIDHNGARAIQWGDDQLLIEDVDHAGLEAICRRDKSCREVCDWNSGWLSGKLSLTLKSGNKRFTVTDCCELCRSGSYP